MPTDPSMKEARLVLAQHTRYGGCSPEQDEALIERVAEALDAQRLRTLREASKACRDIRSTYESTRDVYIRQALDSAADAIDALAAQVGEGRGR